MTLVDTSISFSVYDDNTRSDDTLTSLAILRQEYLKFRNYPHDTAPVESLKRRLANQKWSNMKFVHLLMKDSEKNPIGFSSLYINTGKTNKSLCRSDFFIRPQYRRQGYFKKLFLESLKLLPDYVSIISFSFRVDNNQRHPENQLSLNKKFESLSDEIGAHLASISRKSESDLTKQNLEIVSENAKQLKQKATENGYSIYFVEKLAFENLPFTRAQFVKLLVELDNDMPRDDSVQEDSTFTEEDYVNAFSDVDLTNWLYIAVDNKNQLPIAMTETNIRSTNPDLAYVGDTGVKRDHRGKRLGLTLKILMLERLLTDPLSKDIVKYWITFNAKSNNYMISINDQLGYNQSTLENQYEVPIDKLKNYFESH